MPNSLDVVHLIGPEISLQLTTEGASDNDRQANGLRTEDYLTTRPLDCYHSWPRISVG